MSAARPVAVCALLALAVHAALLLRAPAHPGGSAGARTPGVAVRLATEAPKPADVAPDAAPSVQGPQQAAQESTLAEATPAAVGEPPAFADAAPEIGFPDAELPEAGVQLRAFVQLDAQGQAQQVSTAALPGQAAPPLGYQKVAEIGLRQARFKPAGSASAPAAYCLLLRFERDAPAARLAWLPGAGRDAARCLAGAMPRARELPAG